MYVISKLFCNRVLNDNRLPCTCAIKWLQLKVKVADPLLGTLGQQLTCRNQTDELLLKHLEIHGCSE